MNVNILCSAVPYLNATINAETEMQNWRFELMGLAKSGKTRKLRGMGLGLALQESAGWVSLTVLEPN